MSNVSNVVVNDATPAFTTMFLTPAPVSSSGGAVTAPVLGATGAVSTSFGIMTGNQVQTLNFSVKIDQ